MCSKIFKFGAKIKIFILSNHHFKLNVKKVEEKLKYWESEAQRLKMMLKDEDAVWSSWRSLLQSFKLSMKWIDKLASDTFGVIIKL